MLQTILGMVIVYAKLKIIYSELIIIIVYQTEKI